MAYSKFIFVRHGEGCVDENNPSRMNLTAHAQEQAEKLVNAWTPMLSWYHKRPALIVSSRSSLAIQTSLATRDHFSDAGCEIWGIHEFLPTCPSLSRALPTEEQEREIEEYMKRGDPDFIAREGAESFNKFMGRVRMVRGRMKDVEDSVCVILFTHQLFMKALIWDSGLNIMQSQYDRMREFYDFQKSIVIPYLGQFTVIKGGESLIVKQDFDEVA